VKAVCGKPAAQPNPAPSTKTEYDALGRKTSATDQGGNVTSYGYDAVGNLTSVTDPMGKTTQYAYDELGEKVSQTDANGHTTLFAYDQKGHLTSKSMPGGQTTTMTYNADGTIASQQDANGFTTYFVYDGGGQLTDKWSGPNGTGVHLTNITYNPDSTVASVTRYARSGGQALTVTTAYGYDTATGRLLNVTTTTGTLQHEVSYTYDDDGNKLTTTTPAGTTTYAYDSDNRTSTAAVGGGVIATYGYDNVGNRASLTRANGVTTTYAYDTLNRLTNLTNATSSGTVSSYAYTLNDDGTRASVEDNTGATTTYTYDNDDRLTGESGPNGTITYTYDPVGNRLTKTVGTTSPTVTRYTYNANDWNTAYTYDNDGNVLNDSTNVYAYDEANKLIASGPEGSTTPTTTYVYNCDGMRVQQTNGTTVDNYVLDTSLPSGDVVEERDGSDSLTAHYIYGDDLLRLDTSSMHYYLFDGLGSTRQLTDIGGNVTDTDTYDAFGNLTISTGTTPNPFLYNGQQLDGATGLYYLRARYMNPEDGRFLSQDPYEGNSEDPATLHRYLYAGGDPVNEVDPNGASAFSNDMEKKIQYEYKLDLSRDTFTKGTILGAVGAQYYNGSGWIPTWTGLTRGNKRYFPDIFDYTPGVWTINEIKPMFPQYISYSKGWFTTGRGLDAGIVQMFKYMAAFGPANIYSPGYLPNILWIPPAQPILGIDGNRYFVVNILGVLAYFSVDQMSDGYMIWKMFQQDTEVADAGEAPSLIFAQGAEAIEDEIEPAVLASNDMVISATLTEDVVSRIPEIGAEEEAEDTAADVGAVAVGM
jgi:RHS repeat-associated protein